MAITVADSFLSESNYALYAVFLSFYADMFGVCSTGIAKTRPNKGTCFDSLAYIKM